MHFFRFYYRRVKMCLKAGVASFLSAKIAAQSGMKRVLVFLAMRSLIPARLAGALIRRLGLIHA